MSDFYQTGVVSTFHRLGKVDLERMNQELMAFNQQRPIALVLPSLYDELEGPALKHILKELKQVPYLNEIVVTMGRTDREQYQRAKEFFSPLPQRVRRASGWAPRANDWAQGQVYRDPVGRGIPNDPPQNERATARRPRCSAGGQACSRYLCPG